MTEERPLFPGKIGHLYKNSGKEESLPTDKYRYSPRISAFSLTKGWGVPIIIGDGTGGRIPLFCPPEKRKLTGEGTGPVPPRQIWMRDVI